MSDVSGRVTDKVIIRELRVFNNHSRCIVGRFDLNKTLEKLKDILRAYQECPETGLLSAEP